MCTHQVAALFGVKKRHGRYLERMTSYQISDSVNRCVFIKRTIVPNFIDRSDWQLFLKRSNKKKKNNSKKKKKTSIDMRSVPDP